MKNLNQTPGRRGAAFTLIELLVVIAIIGVLAALVFPALRAAKIGATRAKVRAELKQVETAIEAYKSRYGFYPPDNPGNPANNQLFYELHGTTQKGTLFETLDGRQGILATLIPSAFGASVAGFVNCTKAGGDDDSKAAEKFLSGLRTDQYGIITNSSNPNLRHGVLTCSVPWTPVGGSPELNPWRYNSSSPTHNPKSYDLWVDIQVGGKVNRISNWNKQFEVVN